MQQVIDIYPEPEPRRSLVLAGKVSLALVVVVLLGVAVWLVWRQFQPKPNDSPVVTLLEADIGSDMQVVVVQLRDPMEIGRATLYTMSGEAYEMATPAGKRNTLAFILPHDRVDFINIEPVGAAAFTYHVERSER